MSENHELNRKPSKLEVWLTRIFGIIVLVILGLISYFLIFIQPETEGYVATIIFVSLFLIMFFLMWRIIFGKPSKPSNNAILVFSGCFALILLGVSILILIGEQKVDAKALPVFGSFFVSLSWFLVSWNKRKNEDS